MKNPSLFRLFCFLLLPMALSVCRGAMGAPGDWPEPRQNAHLTAAQPVAGRMGGAPEVIARFDLGRSQPAVTAVARPDGGPVGLCIVAGALQCYDPAGKKLWECHPPGLNFETIVAHEDLNGDGKIEIALQAGRTAQPYGAAALVALDDGRLLWRYDVEPMSYAWYLYTGNYLPDVPTKQIVVIMHAYPPDKANGYIAFFAYPKAVGADAGAGDTPVQQWRYDFDKYTCFPSFLQSDLDADGVKELVVETHSKMWFFDVKTGKVKHFIQWDVSPANIRSYGLVRFLDLNGDGRGDFLCIATFAQHHEVLLNKNGVMEKAWSHGWPESVTTGKVAGTWPEPPQADVDGDGKLEIVVSMFNSEGESAWLTRVYDALTGELKYRAPGLIAVATGDLDNDKAAEILANASSDPTKTRLDGARVLKLKDAAFTTLWQDDTATAIPPNSDAPFCVSRDNRKLALHRSADGAIALEPWEEQGPPAPDFSAVPAILGPPFPQLLAADLTADGRNDLVLYQEPRVQILSLEDREFRNAAQYESSSLPVIADLDGDSGTEIVLSTVKPDALPVIEAKTPSLENKTLWRTTFPEPGRPGLPQPRRAYLRAGRFTGKPTQDLYVWVGTPVVRSAALDGKTGALLWDKGEVPNSERYWGPSVNLASVYDFNGDGKEDVVFTNPDYYCVASGPTGESLLGPLYPPEIFNQPSQGLYTLPAILEKTGTVPSERDGTVPVSSTPSVCLVAGHYFQAAMSLRAEPSWYKLPVAGEARCAQEGFMRLASGEWLMGFGRQNGAFACVNVSDGSTRWDLPLDASASDAVSCDINGDGQPEFLFGTSHGKLYAVADAGASPRVVWTCDLGAACGPPIVADINGDGASEIIVPTADGYVSVFGAPKPSP